MRANREDLNHRALPVEELVRDAGDVWAPPATVDEQVLAELVQLLTRGPCTLGALRAHLQHRPPLDLQYALAVADRLGIVELEAVQSALDEELVHLLVYRLT